MSGERDPRLDLDALLERALVGDPLTAAERAALEGSPEHAAALEDLMDLQSDLSRAGERELEGILAEARGVEQWPGREAFHDRLGGLVEERVRLKRKRRWSVIGVLVAAAAAVLLVQTLRGRGEDLPNVGVPGPGGFDSAVLGPAEDWQLEPHGDVQKLETFTWVYELPPGGWFELRIWDASAADESEPLVELELEEPRWEADRELPATVTWEVRAVGPAGLLAAVSTDARRLP